MSSANDLKTAGNAAFAAGKYEEAIELFTKAIAIDPANHVFYSNRSACYASLKQYDLALEDGEKTVELKSDWGKGYGRKATALYGLGRFDDAKETYSAGLKLDPSNAQLKKGLEDATKAAEEETAEFAGTGVNPFATAFKGDVIGKIASNPKLAPFLAQPDFMAKIREIQGNPHKLQDHMGDQRVMMAALSLMGINASFGTGDEKDDDDSLGSRRDRSPPPAPRSQPQTQPQPAKKPEPEPEPVQVEEPVDPKIAESLKLKEEGNAFYKKKKLTEALDCYERAIALDGTNVSIINNKGATLFELGRFEDCIATCEQAVEVGREQYADFKLIAKALARVGGAYAKLEKFEEAINAYKRSLSEHRTAETLDKLKKVEKQRDVQIKEAYRNPELADKAREEGNVAFKAGDFSKAVGLYTEAIKRNDKDAKPYTNRATAYSKLLAYPEALRDCEKAIELDPAYARAYIRKATIEYSLKEYNKALTTLKEARSIAKEDALKNEIDREEQKVYNAINAQNSSDMTPEQREEAMKRAGRDPEIQAILRDPGMQSILQRMQEDPAAAQAYLRDPKVMDNIQKLVAAGVLRLG